MEIKSAIAVLSGLSQETRLVIYRFLVQCGPAGLPAGKIGEHFGLPAATLSFHLAHLERCGLLSARREGRMIIYSANYETMNDLLAYLTENCCGGDASLCGPAAYNPLTTTESRTTRSRRVDRK